MPHRPFVIGIAGPSGAGKSHFAHELSQKLGATIWQLDHYYLPRALQQADVHGYLNFDLPTALDVNKIVSDFNALLSHQSIHINEYVFNAEGGLKSKKITPNDILIIEGIHTYTWQALSAHIDFKIFIDAPSTLRLSRRLKRDECERGYQAPEITYRFLTHAEDIYHQLLKPIKPLMDFNIELTENQLYPFETLLPRILAKKIALGL
jgi:uridine kinase